MVSSSGSAIGASSQGVGFDPLSLGQSGRPGAGVFSVPGPCRSAFGCRLLGMFVEVHPLSGTSEDAQNLGRLVAGAAEPVRHLGVELGGLSDAEDEILVAEHEAHLTGQDVEPLEPIMGAGVRLGLGFAG